MYATRVTVRLSTGQTQQRVCRDDGSVWRSIASGEWIEKDDPLIEKVEHGTMKFVPS